MITNALLAAVQGIVTLFDALLPSFTAPSWFGGSSTLDTVATYMGDILSPVKSILPVDAIFVVLTGLFVMLPVIAAYTVFSWIWNHVPSIAGFGTH